ncbi:MAG: pyridoxamine 5'-phosphate oxidase family protein [Proteobacteria bacterium]|nr:pyridoxamine 5'-phosphate oxidase family protein [Pseudomonadota bacterium]
MRRKEKEITDKTAIESIILRSSVCRLALSEDNHPYIVPLCFGYKDNTLYFHSALEGKKLDIMKNNNNVCFEFDIDHHIVEAEDACGWGMNYRSVIGFGKVSIIDDPEFKIKAINAIIERYAGKPLKYTKAKLKDTVIIKVEIEGITGKTSGY